TSGNVNGRVQVVFGANNWNTKVQGAGANYFAIHNATPTFGVAFTENDVRMRARVAELGTTVVTNLFGDSNPIGQTIKINKIAFKVIGVLPSKGSTGFMDQDDIIVVPLLTGMYRLLGQDYVGTIDCQAKDASLTLPAIDSITALLRKRHGITNPRDTSFQIRNMADIQAALSQQTNVMTLLLGFI